MPMKYVVSLKETSYAEVEVEADSPEEAEGKAEDMYYAGSLFLEGFVEFSAERAD